jgi:alcohol dehydrogenase
MAGLPRNLKHHGITKADLSALATGAASQWTAQFNPREAEPAEFEEIYASALIAR